MRRIIILYKNELKKIRFALLFIPVLYGIVAVYFRYGYPSHILSGYYGFGVFLLTYGSIFAPPVIFAFLLNDELKLNTVYQLFSLPCRRFTLLLSKYLIAVTVCIITTFGTSACMKLLEKTRFYGYNTVSFSDSVIAIFTSVSWITGIACVTAGVMLSIKRHRQAAGLMLFIALIFLSYKIHDLIKWLIIYKIDWLEWTGKYDSYSVLMLTGIVFVIIGHIIYEKISEI